MNEANFAPKMEQEIESTEELTPEEIEQLVVVVNPEDLKPLPEEIRKKVEALRKKYEEEHGNDK